MMTDSTRPVGPRPSFQWRSAAAQPAPGPTLSESERRARLYSRWMVVCTLLIMGVSGNLLDIFGLAYNQPGGFLPAKLHPVMYLSIVLTYYCFRGRTSAIFTTYRPIGVFLIAMAVSDVVTPFMRGADGIHIIASSATTYLPAALLVLILSDSCDARGRDLVLRTVIVMAALNAAICIVEDVVKENLIPAYGEAVQILLDTGTVDFRGTALYDHPLDGAMFTMMGIFCVLARGAKTRWEQICFLFLLTGLISFGGRTALGLSVILLLSAGLGYAIKRLASGTMTLPEGLRLAAIGVSVPLFFIYVLTGTDLGERLVNHFYWDDSADSRRLQWKMIGLMTRSEWITGIDSKMLDSYAYQVALDFPFEDIENFWLLEFVNRGVISYVFYLIAFFALVIFAWRSASGWGRAMLVSVLFVATSSNSFARKSNVFDMLLPAVVCTYDYRRRNAASAQQGLTQPLKWVVRDAAFVGSRAPGGGRFSPNTSIGSGQ